MKKTLSGLRVLVSVFSVLPIAGVWADVYKCPGPSGSQIYTDKPCSDGYRNKEGDWVSLEQEARNKLEKQKREKLELQKFAIELEERRKRAEQARSWSESAKPQISLQSESIPMSFEVCVSRKAMVIASLNVNPRDIIPIVNTGLMTLDRVCTSDGSVLITCSKPDRKMVITRSPANSEVGCR